MARSKRAAEHESPQPKKRSRIDAPVASPTESVATTEAIEDASSIADTAVTAASTSSRRPKKYICEYPGCGKAFNRPIRVQRHFNTHTGEKPFPCTEGDCDKRFYKPEHLKAHVQNIHSPVAHTCTWIMATDENGFEVLCNMSFTTKSRLSRHVALHETKEETKCDHCGQQFRKMETLQRHVQKEHSKEKGEVFRCTIIVPLSLDEASLMEEFVDTEEGEECGRTFKTNGHLQQHQHYSHAMKKYSCSLCSVEPGAMDLDQINAPQTVEQVVAGETSSTTSFNSYHELQAHIREVHPPTCSACGTVCTTAHALRAHIDVHHGSLSERQVHPCTWPDCDRSFTKKGNLAIHVQTVHVRVRNYICGQFDLSKSRKVAGWNGQGCGTALGTKSSLEAHVQTQHMGMVKPIRPSRLRKKIKFEDDEDDFQDLMPFLDLNLSTPTASDSSVPTPASSNTLQLLTGAGYADNRPFACFAAVEGCLHRFINEYHLAQHMETAHGWSEAEINDALANTSNYDTNLGIDTQKGLYDYAEPLAGLDEMFGVEAMALDPALMET